MTQTTRRPRSSPGARALLLCALSFAGLPLGCGPAASGPPGPVPCVGSCAEAVPPPTPPGGGIDYLIVTGPKLVTAAKAYQTYREQAGYRVGTLVVPPSSSGAGGDPSARIEEIKAFVRGHYERRDPKRPFFLLILGDADDPVPVYRYREPFDGTSNKSDNYYVDLDGDHEPEFPVGRIPARTVEEALVILRKIERHESTYEVGEWNRRLTLFASQGGFSVDYFLEQLTKEYMDAVSYDYDMTMTYASQRSEYVYVPEKISDKVYAEINDGALVAAYQGHGNEAGLDSLSWNGRHFPIFDLARLETKLDVRHKPPLLVILACLTGGFVNRDAFAEEILRTERAPAALIASTEISHPYTNGILFREVAETATADREPTVGQFLWRLKYRLMHQKDRIRDTIDAITKIALKPDEVQALKRTHLHMYTLFGDPAMRLRYVDGRAALTLSSAQVARGGEVEVTAAFDGLRHGRARFSLEVRRKLLAGRTSPVPDDGDPRRDEVIRANHALANNRAVDRAETTIAEGRATVTLRVPATGVGAGTLYVKVYADDGVRDALGSVPVEVVEAGGASSPAEPTSR
ncbi:MAG: hypothetical protein IT371_05480 [Deltaproteobacteria bacterium]|nr:hypothetical protein [Deltaproteobacteria bacterium]